MSTYAFSLTFHVKSDRAIDGEAGLEIPRFFTDLTAAARFCVIQLDVGGLPEADQPRARQEAVEREFLAMIARMPSGLRRRYRAVTPAHRSRWDPYTRTWDRDDSGLALVFRLEREPTDGSASEPFTFPVAEGGGDVDGTATFEVAVDLREV